jgi:hypothetical protein
MRRPAKVAAVLAATLAAASGAFAYWSAGGAGSAAGTGSGPAPLTVAAGTPTQALLPTGAATGDVSLTVTNPNAYAVRVAQLSLDSAAGNAGFSANASVCALSFTAQDNGGAGWSFPSGSTSLVLTNSMTMGTGAASSCQTLTFSVYLKAS